MQPTANPFVTPALAPSRVPQECTVRSATNPGSTDRHLREHPGNIPGTPREQPPTFATPTTTGPNSAESSTNPDLDQVRKSSPPEYAATPPDTNLDAATEENQQHIETNTNPTGPDANPDAAKDNSTRPIPQFVPNSRPRRQHRFESSHRLFSPPSTDWVLRVPLPEGPEERVPQHQLLHDGGVLPRPGGGRQQGRHELRHRSHLRLPHRYR